MPTIAIIGAGFSGTMTAVHLLIRNGTDPLNIHVIERTGRFTAGVAYGTNSPHHLLNVPAGRMSAFDNQPDHFLEWARQRDPSINGGSFVQRRFYGQYLASILAETQSKAAARHNVERILGEAKSMRVQADGTVAIGVSDGRTVRCDVALLAIGNFSPADPPIADMTFYASQRYARDPWAADALECDPNQPVLLIGTGLTMLDIAIALRERGHAAPIHALSRRGLLPQAHRDSATPPPHHHRPETLDAWPRTALGLLRSLRDEIAHAERHGVDWREVLTSLRADTPVLWQSLNPVERERFLRHVRPFWETHRHRSSPATTRLIAAMIESGQLRPVGGRLVAMCEHGHGVEVRFRRRGASQAQSVNVGRVINCTGPDTDLSRVSDPLIQDLRRNGLIRPDELGLGLDSDEHGAIIDAHGRPSRSLFLVGPLRKGQLWENTAVPELRTEARRMTDHLLKVIRMSGVRAG